MIKLKPHINKNKVAVQEVMKRIQCLHLSDVTLYFEVVYDPELNTTVIDEDEDIVKSFQFMPEDPYEKDTELSQYVLRFVLLGEKLVDHRITAEDVVDKIQSEFGRIDTVPIDTIQGTELLKIQWNDEYSNKCILRIRPVVDKNSQPGEDPILLQELGHLMMKDIKVSGIDGIKKVFLQEDKDTGEYIIETNGVNIMEVQMSIFTD